MSWSILGWLWIRMIEGIKQYSTTDMFNAHDPKRWKIKNYTTILLILCRRTTDTNNQCTPVWSVDSCTLLGAKLEKLKAVDVDKLQKELHEEKTRNHELKEKLKHKQKSSSSKLQRYISLLTIQLSLSITATLGIEVVVNIMG